MASFTRISRPRGRRSRGPPFDCRDQTFVEVVQGLDAVGALNSNGNTDDADALYLLDDAFGDGGVKIIFNHDQRDVLCANGFEDSECALPLVARQEGVRGLPRLGS